MNSLNTYFRVIRYARPYWKHIGLSIGCTIFYSVFSGASIYFFIPLLDILFHPERSVGGGTADALRIPFGFAGVFLFHELR
ncbi:MAG: hypothetical protein HY277_00825 [Ignavibacteriales bacterium]|nr:hypothetical protein [Ignavibacteriales bacterium]